MNQNVRQLIKTGVAALVITAFFGTWLAMEWFQREPDSLILIGAVAIALGAGYYLWDEAMGEGVEAADTLRGEDSEEGDG